MCKTKQNRKTQIHKDTDTPESKRCPTQPVKKPQPAQSQVVTDSCQPTTTDTQYLHAASCSCWWWGDVAAATTDHRSLTRSVKKPGHTNSENHRSQCAPVSHSGVAKSPLQVCLDLPCRAASPKDAVQTPYDALTLSARRAGLHLNHLDIRTMHDEQVWETVCVHLNCERSVKPSLTPCL